MQFQLVFRKIPSKFLPEINKICLEKVLLFRNGFLEEWFFSMYLCDFVIPYAD